MKKLYSGNPMIHISGSYSEYKNLCETPITRGELITHSPLTATCKKCMADFKNQIKEADEESSRPRTTKEKLEWWAHFGNGEFGILDWFAVGFFTLGFGIPIVWIIKNISKLVLKKFYA